MKKRFLLALALALGLVLLLPALSLAAGLKDLWVEGILSSGGAEAVSPGEGRREIDAVRWWYDEGTREYVLFLPSSARPESLRLCFTGTEALTANEKTVASGDAVDFLVPGETCVLTADKRQYTLRVMQSAGVPALFIANESGNLDYIHKRKGNQETGVLALAMPDGSLAYNGALQHIKGRGNSTFFLLKKPYQIKLEDSTDLCGMGKNKSWILLADFRDNSLLRNKVAFAMAEAVGLPYTSKSQHADVYINNDYLGTYLLCEKVEYGKNRVNITELDAATEDINNEPLEEYPAFGKILPAPGSGKGVQIPADPEDITGGYILQLEYEIRYQNEVSGFVTTKGQPVIIKDPEYASKAQVQYVSDLIKSFESAIFSKDGVDPKSGKHYSQIVDMDSLVRKYLLEEITKNHDANRSSQYLFKDVDQKSPLFFMGPAWDYDAALGNFARSSASKEWWPQFFSANADQGEPYYWYPALYQQPDFYKNAVSAFYRDYVPVLEVLLGLREGDPEGELRTIDEYAQAIAPSAAMNYVRWPVFNSKARVVKTGANYEENIDFLKNFLQKRMEFLSGEWTK